MPFKSSSQAKLLWATHPAIAKKWSKEYKQKINKLPKHVNDSKPKPMFHGFTHPLTNIGSVK